VGRSLADAVTVNMRSGPLSDWRSQPAEPALGVPAWSYSRTELPDLAGWQSGVARI